MRSRVVRFPGGVLDGLLVALAAALAYLPLAPRLGFYADDWYLVYAGHTQGIQKFWDIFIIDRPLRALQVGAWYALFGDAALPYSLTAYLWRVLAALALLRIARALWPGLRAVTALMALLFAIYPGFPDMVNALDFQSHLLSLCLALWSIAWSLDALRAASRGHTLRAVGLGALSFVAALLYLGLMEYYIGLEALRLGAMLVLALREPGGLRGRLGRGMRRWLPFAAAPAVFLFWRAFLFENQRGATDLSAMFSALAGSPLLRGLWTLVYLLQDLLNTLFFAWAVPAYQTLFRLRLRDFLLALLVGALAALVSWAVLRIARATEGEEVGEDRFAAEAMLLGLGAAAAALLPVTLGDRHIQFPLYARFTLTPAVGACVALAALLWRVRGARLRMGLAAVLVFVSVAYHYANAQNAVNQFRDIQTFWWQVAWRAPGIRENTNLVANYAVAPITEDYFVWSPANLIYYPQHKDGSPTPLSLAATVLNGDTARKILAGAASEQVDRRGLLLTRDYENLLVLSRPMEGSCVQVMDGRQPEFSSVEAYDIMLVAPYSRIANLVSQGSAPTPPAAIFGPEPEHGWCYSYEKAALARQTGDWAKVARLGDEALANDLRPLDRVEWLPFVQAYAHLGRDERVRALAPVINEQPILSRQVCDAAGAGTGWYAGLDAAARDDLLALFCR